MWNIQTLTADEAAARYEPKPKAKAQRFISGKYYRLPDGRQFYYLGKWDLHGTVVIKMPDPQSPNTLVNHTVGRRSLDGSTIIKSGEKKDWTLAEK